VSMRILHIVGDSKYGGGSYIILRMAQMARVAGWEPWVLTTDPVFQQVLAENALSYTDCTLIPREIHPYHRGDRCRWELRGRSGRKNRLSCASPRSKGAHTSNAACHAPVGKRSNRDGTSRTRACCAEL